MNRTRIELAQNMHAWSGKDLDQCLQELNELTDAELEAVMAKADAQCRAYLAAIERGENLEVELPPGRNRK